MVHTDGLPPALEGEVDHHEAQGQNGAHRDAHNGAGGTLVLRTAQLHQIDGQGQTQDQLAQRLDDLGDGGGGHVAVPLGIAPEGRQAAHAHHRRGEDPDAVRGHGVPHQVGEMGRAEVHDEEGDEPQDQEGAQGHMEHLVDLIPASHGVGLGHHLGQRHRKPGGGDGQQHRVDVIGIGEVGIPGIPDDAHQGDLVEHADDLHNGDPRRQDGGAAEEGAFWGELTGHGQAS